MNIRRIVTGEVNGKSVFVSDSDAPNTYKYRNIPGFSTSLIWSTSGDTSPCKAGMDPATPGVSLLPGDGETKFMIVTFPPDSIFHSANFDFQAAIEEQEKNLVGLFEKFEPDNPGMHKTATIDYGIVLSGTVTLELDDGNTRELNPGTVVVQQGTRHAWRNSSNEIAVMAFTMIGYQI